MYKATYIGDREVLQGETALVRPGAKGKWLAQFDDLSLVELAHGWHEFDKSYFYVEPGEADFGDDHHPGGRYTILVDRNN